MKKLFCVLTAVAVTASLASCGDSGTTAGSSVAPASSQAVISSQAPASSETISIPAVSVDDRTLAEKFPLNLAFQGKAIVDSESEDYAGITGGAAALNDGDKESRWQSNSDKDEEGNGIPEDKDHPSWLGIQWEEAKTFDTITCLWEVAHPAKDGFYVEISDDGETWTKVDFTVEREGEDKDDKQFDTITLKKAVETKAVRIYCFTHYVVPEGRENEGNAKSPTSCYEIEIYNSVDVAAAEAEASAEPAESAEADTSDVTAG